MGIQALVCTECGAQIQIDDSREFGFCSYCGTKVLLKQIVEIKHTGLNVQDTKKDQLNEMLRIKTYVDERLNDYTELGELRRMLSIFKPDASVPMAFFGLVLWFFGAIGVLASFTNASGFPIISVLLILCGFVLIIFYYKDYVDDVNYKKSLIEDINSLNSDLREYYEAYDECPIGMEYFCPDIVNKLYGYMKNGRADSIKEALNVYEDDKHKGQMTKQAMIVAQNTAITAKMATVTAINSMIKR